MLPNLLIAGVPKAGTSSLFSYLAQHPDICPSSVKEPGYFNALRHEGGSLDPLDIYEQHFAHCRDERYVMEGTPAYCYGGERVRAGIRDTLGRPRILFSLREPVSRAWSEYTMHRTKGRLVGLHSFEEYVAACEGVRRGAEPRHMRGLSIGFYADYLPAWFDAFGDAVHVTFAEDLFDDPQTVVAELCRWLGLDDAVAASFDYSARNPTTHARSPRVGRAIFALKERADRPLRRAPALRGALRDTYVRLGTGPLQEKLEPSTRQRLQALYRPSNVALAALLTRRGHERLPAWLEAAAASRH